LRAGARVVALPPEAFVNFHEARLALRTAQLSAPQSPRQMSSPPPSPVQQQPLLFQTSPGAAATAPLQEEPGSPAKSYDSGEDEDPWPGGMLRCTPDKPAFSKTPSPDKEFQEQVPPSPSPPDCTPSHACASQVFESSSDHSSRYTPVSEGTKAWVADSFIDGQPMSSRRRGMKRRAALTYNLTGDAPSKHDPSSSSGTTFKPTARRPFDYLPEHQLDFAEEDDE